MHAVAVRAHKVPARWRRTRRNRRGVESFQKIQVNEHTENPSSLERILCYPRGAEFLANLCLFMDETDQHLITHHYFLDVRRFHLHI